MEKKHKKALKISLGGLAVGIVNGLLGAGGGMLAVPLLRSAGLETKQAHRNSVAIILPISAFSAFIYLQNGSVSFADAAPYLIPGAVGAVCGTWLMRRLSNKLIGRAFGVFMLWAGIRLVLK